MKEQRAESPSREEDCEYQDAVAAVSALVGESVVDSPEVLRTVRDIENLGSRNPLPDLHDRQRPMPPTGNPPPPLIPENANAMSVGLMAQGFAWVRKQREGRKRNYLRSQAEMQLQKIKEAQKAEESETSSTRSLTASTLFQNFINQSLITRSESSDRKSETEDEEDESRQKPSISGDGITVEIAVSEDREDHDASFIPQVRVEPEPDLESNPCILTAAEMQQIAVYVLPRGIADCRWKRLYSLARDGDAFDVCLRLVANNRRTLLVVRTNKGAVFGGFADSVWRPHGHGGANFFGGSTSCLFRVTNGKIKAYPWSGANHYVQLCDTSNKRIAFGGGGQEGMFGLCLQDDFEMGSTGHCDTFNNEPLCEDERFHIVDVEVFGFLVGQF